MKLRMSVYEDWMKLNQTTEAKDEQQRQKNRVKHISLSLENFQVRVHCTINTVYSVEMIGLIMRYDCVSLSDFLSYFHNSEHMWYS